MAEAARQRDVIDTAPPFTAADVERLTARFAGMPSADMLDELLRGELRGRVVAVSSFFRLFLLDVVFITDSITFIAFFVCWVTP